MNNNIVIVLVETIFPENIGAVARGMFNFGFNNLRLVNTCDHKCKRAFDLACNAKNVLDKAQTFKSLDEAILDCTLAIGFTRRLGSRRIPKPWESIAEDTYNRSKQREKIALVFGREDKGLSKKETILCNELSIIKTNKNCPSINLAQSVTVATYELSKHAKSKIALPRKFTASARDSNKTLKNLNNLLIKLDYQDDKLINKINTRIKNIFSRAGIETADLKMLEGLMGQIRKIISK